MVEIARQSIKKIATTVSGYWMLKQEIRAVIEFKNFIEECVELEEREAIMEENRRAAEALVRVRQFALMLDLKMYFMSAAVAM